MPDNFKALRRHLPPLSFTRRLDEVAEHGDRRAGCHFVQRIAAFALIVALPWLFIAMTFPNTLGKFVNDSFENGWREFGNDTADTKRLKLVLIVYVALLLSGALVWNGVLS